jgi:2'-5' RNA ligase
MPSVVALDVALLLPPGARQRAVQASAGLPPAESQGLRLDDEHIPHITLTQQFVQLDEMDAVFQCIDSTLLGHPPIQIHVTGGGRAGSAVWMVVARTDAIATLHGRLMRALRDLERPAGTTAAFVDEDARAGDVAWVAGYRDHSSLSAYTPHVTVGHAATPPDIAPFTFEATTVAACHLGRFCSCRRVLRSWELT